MSAITTHVLDTSRGEPARGLRLELERQGADGHFRSVSRATTDSDGRSGPFAVDASSPGIFRLVFATGEYFDARQVESFYPEVAVVFEVDDPKEHYHVPLLLSPFGYSTYRGS